MHTVTSPDGTTIAYDRTGAGDPLVLVAGAFSYRRYPGQVKLAELLSGRFTVYSYDRRGRGDSGDTQPYAIEREIEDLGRGDRRGRRRRRTSGACRPARCWPSKRPPPGCRSASWPCRSRRSGSTPRTGGPPADLRQQVTALIDAGQRGAAVRYFMVDGMGAPVVRPRACCG